MGGARARARQLGVAARVAGERPEQRDRRHLGREIERLLC
jgi:hypothetical protein